MTDPLIFQKWFRATRGCFGRKTAHSSRIRAQNQTYHFVDTDTDLLYAVFVSSKVAPDKKSPLIIALHGPQCGASCGRRSAESVGVGQKDATNLLTMARKEFNVDEHRTYLMGYSMGGAGTLYLGSKFASDWAAVAAIEPAARRLVSNIQSILTKLTMPVLVVQGDADLAVPVENTRKWTVAMKQRSI